MTDLLSEDLGVPNQAGLFDRRLLPPRWPFMALFSLYPLWWFLGLAEFVWVIFPAAMAAALVMRRDIAIPRGFGPYILFVFWMFVTVIQIDSANRLIGFSLRAGYYVGVGVLVLFVANAPFDLSVHKMIKALTYFWLAIVGGGWLGLVLPGFTLRTPMSFLMPGPLISNDWIRSMVVLQTAQVHDILGFPIPRPTAPFTFTNGWGAAFALTTPFALAAMADPRVGISRRTLRIAAAASVVPVVFSLNRGLWLSLTLGLLYASVRFFAAGQARALIALLAVMVIGGVLLTFTPLGGLVQSRIDTPHSDEDRGSLYEEAIARTFESPFIGQGAPRPSRIRPDGPSIGTHGQIWLVTFSHGFVGAGLFVGYLLSTLWASRSPGSILGFWCHIVVVIGIIQIFFYGHLPQQLSVIAVAGGIAVIESSGKKRPTERGLGETLNTPDGAATPMAMAGQPLGEGSDESLPDRLAYALEMLNRRTADEGSYEMIERRGPDGRSNWIKNAPERRPTRFTDRDGTQDGVPADHRDLEWIGDVLWDAQLGRRLSPTPEVRSGEFVLDRWMVNPSAEAPRLMLQEGSKPASAALRRFSDASTPIERVRSAGAVTAMRVGFGERLVPHRLFEIGPSQAATKQPDLCLLDHLEMTLGESNLHIALTIGPRRANRKPVLQLTRPDGSVVGFVKVGWDDLSRELVRNEAEWLHFLGSRHMRYLDVPALIHQSSWRGFDLVVVAPAKMSAVPTRRVRSDPPIKAMWEIASLEGAAPTKLRDSRFLAHHSAVGLDRLQPLLPAMASKFGEVLIQEGCWHGDFSPWNLSSGASWSPSNPRRIDRSLSVIDWEFASSAVPVGLDLLHYHLQIEHIMDERSGAEALRRSWESSRPNLSALGVDHGNEAVTHACHLLELVSRSEQLARNGEPKRLVDLGQAAERRLIDLLR